MENPTEEHTYRLLPITIKKADGKYTFTCEGYDSYTTDKDIASVRKALLRMKSKDGNGKDKKRSSKNGTYLSMLGDDTVNEVSINVWKSKYPKTLDEFNKLFESSEIKLTKTYIIEGTYCQKGSIIEVLT